MTFRSLLLISIALGTLAGCGLKGSLYLPEEEGKEAIDESDTQQRKERTRDSGAQTPAAPTDASASPPATTPPPEN